MLAASRTPGSARSGARATAGVGKVDLTEGEAAKEGCAC